MFVSVKCYVVLLDSYFLFLPVVVDMQYDLFDCRLLLQYPRDDARLVVRGYR